MLNANIASQAYVPFRQGLFHFEEGSGNLLGGRCRSCERVAYSRTARRLMEGYAFLRPSVLEASNRPDDSRGEETIAR